MKWAQNISHVFINVKLSHRHDAPGCLDVFNERMDFTTNSLNFSAFGIQAHVPINFQLALTFDSAIVPDFATWQKESVGTMTITLRKWENQLWRKIVPTRELIDRHQIQLWWEMREVYKIDFDNYLEMLENDEEEEYNSVNLLDFPIV